MSSPAFNTRSSSSPVKMVARVDMWKHSTDLNRRLEAFGARLHGSIEQREDRLRRFQDASNNRILEENRGRIVLNNAIQNARHDYNTRCNKRIVEAMEEDTTYSSPSRDQKTGEPSLKRAKLVLDATIAGLIDRSIDTSESLTDTLYKYRNDLDNLHNIRDISRAIQVLSSSLLDMMDAQVVSDPQRLNIPTM